MIFRPLAPLHNITYSVFIISNHRRRFLANCGQTETKLRVQILGQNHWLITQKNSNNTIRRRKPHLSHMFTKLAPVVEKVDSTIRRIDSFSCLRKKLSDVVWTPVYNHFTQKSCRPTTPNIVGCYTCCVRLHTLLHILACCGSSCAKFETDQTFSYVQWTQQLPRILGVVNLSDIWWSTFKSVRYRFVPLQLVCEQKLYPIWS